MESTNDDKREALEKTLGVDAINGCVAQKIIV